MLKFKVTPQLKKTKFCLKPSSDGHLLTVRFRIIGGAGIVGGVGNFSIY